MQPPHFFHDQFGHIQSTAKVLNLGQLRTNLGSNRVEGLNTRAPKYEHSALTTQQPPTKIDWSVRSLTLELVTSWKLLGSLYSSLENKTN